MNTSGESPLPFDPSGKPDTSTVQGRKVLVAMNLLRQMFAPLTQAVIENTKQYQLGIEQAKTESEKSPATYGVMPPDAAKPGSDSASSARKPQQQPQPKSAEQPTAKPGDKPPSVRPQEGKSATSGVVASLLSLFAKNKGDTAGGTAAPGSTSGRGSLMSRFLQNFIGKERTQRLGKRIRSAGKALRRGMKTASRTVRRRGVRGALKLGAGKGAKGLARGAAGAAAGAAGAALRLLSMAAGKLVAPFMVLSSILGSSNSGMQTFNKATQLAAMVIAPIFLPALIIAAASLMALSEEIWSEMLPVLGEYFGLMKYGIFIQVAVLRGLAVFIRVLAKLGNFIIDLINKLADFLGLEGGISRMNEGGGGQTDPERERIIKEENDRRDQRATVILEKIKAENRAAGKPEFGENNDAAAEAYRRATVERDQRLAERGVFDADKPPGARPRRGVDMGDRFKLALNDAIVSFRMSVMPKAQFSGLADAQKNAQLAALNQDPIEARMLKVLMDSVQLLDRIQDNTRPAAKPGVHNQRP